MAKGNCLHCGKETFTRGENKVKQHRNSLCCNRAKRKKEQEAKRKALGKRECLQCRKDITHMAISAKYCSKRCANDYSYGKEVKKNCEECGKEFVTRDNRHKFCCGECRQKNRNENRPKREKIKKKCTVCSKDFIAPRVDAKYCSTKCRNDHFNFSRRKFISCKCVECGKKFQTSDKRIKTCSEECKAKQNTKEIFNRECPHCAKKFTTTRKNKKFCSIDCSKGKVYDKPLLVKDCPQCRKSFETTIKYKKFCSRECGKKFDNTRTYARTVTQKPKKINKIKSSQPVHDKVVEKSDVTVFVSQSMPKMTPKEGLARKIAEREKKRKANDMCRLELMQKEWMKKNKVKESHAPKTRYEPYSGQEEPTNVLTSNRMFSSRGSIVFNPTEGNKDFGDSYAVHLG